jgi:hypothetical protein
LFFAGYPAENEIFYLNLFGNNSSPFITAIPSNPIKGVVTMRRFSFFKTCAVVAFSLMMIGCAKEPVQELSAAKAAIASAKAAQADRYLAREFAAVQDSLKAAEAEIAKQKAASSLGRNFDKAKATLASVLSLAAPLNAKAVEEKAKVQTETDFAIGKLTAVVSEVKALAKKAPRGKEAKALFEARGKDITAVEATLADIKGLKSSGDFMGALDKANAGIAKIESVKTELNAETEKSAQPKSKKKK